MLKSIYCCQKIILRPSQNSTKTKREAKHLNANLLCRYKIPYQIVAVLTVNVNRFDTVYNRMAKYQRTVFSSTHNFPTKWVEYRKCWYNEKLSGFCDNMQVFSRRGLWWIQYQFLFFHRLKFPRFFVCHECENDTKTIKFWCSTALLRRKRSKATLKHEQNRKKPLLITTPKINLNGKRYKCETIIEILRKLKLCKRATVVI